MFSNGFKTFQALRNMIRDFRKFDGASLELKGSPRRSQMGYLWHFEMFQGSLNVLKNYRGSQGTTGELHDVGKSLLT